MLKPDLCVVGGGAGGLTAASIAASFGVSVVLIEQSAMGGESLNTGSVPANALIAAASRLKAIHEARRFGIVTGGEVSADFVNVKASMRGVVGAIEPLASGERMAAMGIRVIHAQASFRDETTIVAGDCEVKARHFVIATGSEAEIPAIHGLDGVPFLTTDTIFNLADRPDHLVVLGAGASGVELAQAYRRLGSKVTLVESATRILPQEDPEMSAVIERALRGDGIDLRISVAIERVEPSPDGGLTLQLGDGQPIMGTHLLVAAGRRPRIHDLGLDAARIKNDDSGIVVDRGLKTSNVRVYAIGDCAGGAARGGHSTHGADHQAGLVIRNTLFRLPINAEDAPIPRVTFTDPELATVGLSEEQARAKYRAIRILRWPFAENDRARVDHATAGHVKAVVTPRGQVLGCAITGLNAGELISPWTLAIAQNLKISDLAGLVFPYPTFSEASKRAGVEFVKPTTQSPWVRRFIGLARIFG
ncbi:NAD(P)/FAD-dependent oxidoreductase [Microvirga sp. 2MCAF38]|uniref:dihydrolipoyl dehydrogenase family protein n=1 Tax=Microvirga sp. 2MCAF38 TaxID=3232989 RepID=UPI003F9E03EA